MRKPIIVLGATGSIGTQCLDILQFSLEYELIGVSLNSRFENLEPYLFYFDSLKYVAISDKEAAEKFKKLHPSYVVFTGEDSSLALMKECNKADVFNALIGNCGLRPTLLAMRQNQDIMLSNKESLVIGSSLIKEEAKTSKSHLYPVDSEHVALAKLIKEASERHVDKKNILKYIVTASGGALRDVKKEDLTQVTPEQVLHHPTWAMGSKITCDSATLVNKGYEVTVFEALHKTGGVLVYGIPQFRLPKEIVAAEVSKLEAKGVKFVTDAVVGRAITVDELMKEEGFESVFIGTGAGLPSFMNIPGENLIGVCSANEYLTRINLMKAYLPEYDTPIMHGDRIAVVGGGNVAMDAARCAKRMGASEVYVIYRRSMEELPARAEEVHHAIEEGCIFKLLHNPVQILGDEDGNVKAIECVQMELGEPDASGRRRPIPIEGSNFEVPVDMVIMSIGTKLNTLILDTTDQLEANKRGGIGTDDAAATNRDGIFAGGDAVTGAATVIKAMGAGKVAAASMDEYLSK